jgi:hypothetical protein
LKSRALRDRGRPRPADPGCSPGCRASFELCGPGTCGTKRCSFSGLGADRQRFLAGRCSGVAGEGKEPRGHPPAPALIACRLPSGRASALPASSQSGWPGPAG